MKNPNLRILAIISLAVLIGFTVFSFVSPAMKVYKPVKETKDTVHIKLIKEVNGKLTEFDSTIYVDNYYDIDGLIKAKNLAMDKNIDITINMDSIMTIVHQSLVNLPDKDSLIMIINTSLKNIPDMDSIETVINKSMKEMPDMDSIMTLVETGMKECPKKIRIVMSDSINPDCLIYFDEKDIKNEPNATKIIKDENKTIIIKCDKGNGNVTVKEIGGKNCKNSHTMVCKVIIDDPSEKEKTIIKKSYNTNDNLNIDKLNFFPNPGTGKFNLSFTTEKKEKTEISILDANGKEVYQEIITDFNGVYSKEIDISQNPKGAYFLIIKQGKNALTKKLIVQ